MRNIAVRGTEEALQYLEEVAREMVILFPIRMDEAVGRINREFLNRTFLTPIEVDVLLHEEQDVWAKHIYYGRDSCWWLCEDGLRPQPYDDEPC